MKKITLLILALCVMQGLTACSSGGGSSDNTSGNNNALNTSSDIKV